MIRQETVGQRRDRLARERVQREIEAAELERQKMLRAAEILAARERRRLDLMAEQERISVALEELGNDPAFVSRARFRVWLDGPEHAEIQAAFERLTPDPPSVTARRRHELIAATTAERRTA